jgi:phage shock protein A
MDHVMGFFSRMGQLWNGFLSIFVSNLENKNPEAVYEAAIEERVKKHRELKKAVASIVYLRNKIQNELDENEREQAELESQIPVAVEEGEDEVALVLLEKQEKLQTRNVELRLELEKISHQAEASKESLVAFQADIQKLKQEKVEMLAKKQQAEARIKIQETLDGLSTDADVQALDNVRQNIEQLNAEADIGNELGDASLDAKLAKIKKKAGSANAQRKLDELKKKQAAKKKDAATNVNKTI